MAYDKQVRKQDWQSDVHAILLLPSGGHSYEGPLMAKNVIDLILG